MFGLYHAESANLSYQPDDDIYIDKNLIMENMLGANTIPLTLLIDANGKVLKKVRGFKEWDSPETVKMIGAQFKTSM